MNYAARMQKAIPIIEVLHAMGEGTTFLDMGEYEAETVRISYFPPEKARLGTFHYLKQTFGKLEKGDHGTLRGSKDGVDVTIFGVLTCKVIGQRTVEVPAKEAHTLTMPVYECLTPLAAAASDAPKEEVPF